MATQTIPLLTEDEYLALDLANQFRSEFVDGEMLAMSGGSARHSVVAVRVTTELSLQLAGRGCFVFNSDMRLRIAASGAYVYPDVSVVCGEAQFHKKRSDILTNPTFIIEVLSPSTESFDRSRKFDLYRELESLKDYLLVDARAPKVMHFSRQPDESWVFRTMGQEGTVYIPSISVTLNLASIYADLTGLPG